MNFSKVKAIMIACLLAANILIGFFCRSLYSEKNYISEEEAQLAGTHLSTMGITVDLDREERRKYRLPVYHAEAPSADSDVPELYRNATEIFFGRRIADTDYVDTPGGFSVSVKNNDGDTVGTSSFTGSMSFGCSRSSVADSALEEALTESFYARRGTFYQNREDEAAAKQFASEVFRKSELDTVLLGSKQYDRGSIIYFGVLLSDVPVVDMYMNIFVKDGSVGAFAASITDSVPVKAYSTDMTDSIDALYTFANYAQPSDKGSVERENITVNSLEVMYKTMQNDRGGFYFIPAWRIDYTAGDGSERTVLFDAVTGENRYSIS